MTEWEEKYLHERVERLENRINEQDRQIYRLQLELKDRQKENEWLKTKTLSSCFAYAMLICCLLGVGALSTRIILTAIKELMSG